MAGVVTSCWQALSHVDRVLPLLLANASYQRIIDSGGRAPPPPSPRAAERAALCGDLEELLRSVGMEKYVQQMFELV